MSKDFATRSIDISDESSRIKPTISERRKWEKSSHPYLFFNLDETFTFFNIFLDNSCNLIDEKNNILEQNIMTRGLFEQLKLQNRQDIIPIFNSNFTGMIYAIFCASLHVETFGEACCQCTFNLCLPFYFITTIQTEILFSGYYTLNFFKTLLLNYQKEFYS